MSIVSGKIATNSKLPKFKVVGRVSITEYKKYILYMNNVIKTNWK